MQTVLVHVDFDYFSPTNDSNLLTLIVAVSSVVNQVSISLVLSALVVKGEKDLLVSGTGIVKGLRDRVGSSTRVCTVDTGITIIMPAIKVTFLLVSEEHHFRTQLQVRAKVGVAGSEVLGNGFTVHERTARDELCFLVDDVSNLIAMIVVIVAKDYQDVSIVMAVTAFERRIVSGAFIKALDIRTVGNLSKDMVFGSGVKELEVAEPFTTGVVG